MAVTDQNGQYTFDDLAMGEYRVHVEMTGYQTEDKMVTLSEQDKEKSTDFEVKDGKVRVESETTGLENKRGKVAFHIYPVPAKSEINLEFNAQKAHDMTLEIIDTKGRQLQSNAIRAVEGHNKISVNVSSLKSGAYVIRLVDSNGAIAGAKPLLVK